MIEGKMNGPKYREILFVYMIFFLILPLFLPNFMVSNCFSSYYLVSSLQLPYGLGRDEG